mgnify:CR=1 FL=1
MKKEKGNKATRVRFKSKSFMISGISGPIILVIKEITKNVLLGRLETSEDFKVSEKKEPVEKQTSEIESLKITVINHHSRLGNNHSSYFQ